MAGLKYWDEVAQDWVLLAGPGQGYPVGGNPNDVLTKASATDYDTIWLPPAPGIPNGGATADVLAKASVADQDVIWRPGGIPPGGNTNDVLTKTSATDYDTRWAGLPSPSTSATVEVFVDYTGEVWVARVDIAAGAWKRARDVMHCRVYRNNPFDIPTTVTLLPWDFGVDDVYGICGATGEFFPPVAGMWRIDGSLSWASQANQDCVNWRITHNAANAALVRTTSYVQATQTTQTDSQVGTLLRVATGDVISFSVQLIAGTGTRVVTAGSYMTWATLSYLGTG
jgi:hypothetical protein